MTGNDTERQRPFGSASATAQAQVKELAEVCGRFADLCQHLSQQNTKLPSQIVEEVRHIWKLTVDDRITQMKLLNQELMAYLHDAGPHHEVPQ